MSTNTALRHSPAELEAALSAAQDRLDVLRCVKQLRDERLNLVTRLGEIDQILSVTLAEALREALLATPPRKIRR